MSEKKPVLFALKHYTQLAVFCFLLTQIK